VKHSSSSPLCWLTPPNEVGQCMKFFISNLVKVCIVIVEWFGVMKAHIMVMIVSPCEGVLRLPFHNWPKCTKSGHKLHSITFLI
jgi:hypothetical protein